MDNPADWNDEKLRDINDRYMAACHAMQTGVAAKMGIDPKDTTPKHLRVGVNSALVDSSAMARLLVSKGIITSQEYLEAITTVMEEETERYRIWLEEHTGQHIHLA